MENEECARRRMPFTACILPLYHPTVQCSHCFILVAIETYGEICLLVGLSGMGLYDKCLPEIADSIHGGGWQAGRLGET